MNEITRFFWKVYSKNKNYDNKLCQMVYTQGVMRFAKKIGAYEKKSKPYLVKDFQKKCKKLKVDKSTSLGFLNKLDSIKNEKENTVQYKIDAIIGKLEFIIKTNKKGEKIYQFEFNESLF